MNSLTLVTINTGHQLKISRCINSMSGQTHGYHVQALSGPYIPIVENSRTGFLICLFKISATYSLWRQVQINNIQGMFSWRIVEKFLKFSVVEKRAKGSAVIAWLAASPQHC